MITNKNQRNKLVKGIKVFYDCDMVVKDTKISQKMKNKSWLSIEEKFYRIRKSVVL